MVHYYLISLCKDKMNKEEIDALQVGDFLQLQLGKTHNKISLDSVLKIIKINSEQVQVRITNKLSKTNIAEFYSIDQPMLNGEVLTWKRKTFENYCYTFLEKTRYSE